MTTRDRVTTFGLKSCHCVNDKFIVYTEFKSLK